MGLTPGIRFAQYQIVAHLGSGGMGEVYRARDTRLQREVALKVLPAELVGDADRRQRFVREARAASALEHPNIAVVHEIDEADGVPFIAMELLRGESLAAAIGRAPLTVPRAIDLAIEITEGLARAHDIGIVHRDLKPANVMITEQGHAKIIDFGLAKLIQPDEDAAKLTASIHPTEMGAVLGTAAYMSPEQAMGGKVDSRSDIFSFGIGLFEMLTGRPPFRGRSSLETLRAILHDPPAPLQIVSPAVADLERIVGKCLMKEPDDRYQSMRDVIVDLRTVRRRLDSASMPAADLSTRTRRTEAGRRAIIAAAIFVMVFGGAGAGGWIVMRRVQAEDDRRAAIAEIEQLVDRGRFVDVWRAANQALHRWPGDPQLAQMLASTSNVVNLATDPPGADAAFKAYDDPDGEWVRAGTTPLQGVRAPLGMLRWRLTKPGFEPLEARLEVGVPAAASGRPDADAAPVRLRPSGGELARMVFVPSGAERGLRLTEYWIDETEVTNRDFKAFVDGGGYDDPRFWADLRARAAAFRDRTGRPGPAGWELGAFPDGQEDYPVSGVSWFEAVAYCRFAGKTLPTAYHWQRAFGATFFAEVVTLGNFGGRGPESTTRLKDVGPFGTYGMSGNVKEWVWNTADDENRYILGGGWNEPVYMAVDDDVRPAADRAETNGFRCARETPGSEAAAYAAVAPAPADDVATERPVDDATFEVFRRFYSYDRTPLEARIEHVEESAAWRRERVSFTAAYGGERVLANILIPRNAAPPYQTVIWFPGSYALLLKASDKELPFSFYFDFLPRSGRALVYPIYKGTYERAVPVKGESGWRDLAIQWSKDLGRTIDYLETRTDFDASRIAYYGFSRGATDGAVSAVAVEPRLKAAIFLVGGLALNQNVLPEVKAVNFLPRITTPVLMLGGSHDFVFPVERSQKPFFRLLGTPADQKRQVIYEGAGHVPPRLDVIREVLDWLDRYLGRVAAGAAAKN